MKNKQFMSFYMLGASCKVCRFLQRTITSWQLRLAPPMATDIILRPSFLSSIRKRSKFRMLGTESSEYSNSYMRTMAVLDNSWDKLNLAPRRIELDPIDFGIFKDLIILRGREGTQCRLTMVSGFRAVRIAEEKLIPAPCHTYVWGETEASSEEDLTSAPLVVKDAMSVAADLDCEYFWVDRYVGRTGLTCYP